MALKRDKTKTMVSGWRLTFLLILCVSVLIPTNGYTQGNLHLGRLAISPSLSYDLLYSDNIFIAAENEQDDFIHTITPGFMLNYAGSTGNVFTAGYSVNIARYTDLTANNYERHAPFASLSYSLPFGFYLKAGDNFTWSKDPFGSFNEFDQSNRFGLGEKTERWENTASGTIGYNFSERYFTEITYKHYIVDYANSDDDWQDRMDNYIAAALFYRLTPKTAVFTEFRYTDSEHTEQNDGVFDPGRGTSWSSETSQDNKLMDFIVGARFEPGGKLSGEARLGYGAKQFENSVDVLGNAFEDTSTFVASVFLSYMPTARTNLGLNIQRSHLGSPDADASSFINTLVQLRLNQELMYRLTVNLGLDFNNDDYQNEFAGRPEKYFNKYGTTIGLSWAIKPWMSAGVQYQYEENVASDAVYESSEYIVNKATFTIKATY